MANMTIKFAKYAFKDILELLNYSGINEITITKEDSELEIVIPERVFEYTGYRDTVYSGVLTNSKSISGKRISGYVIDE